MGWFKYSIEILPVALAIALGISLRPWVKRMLQDWGGRSRLRGSTFPKNPPREAHGPKAGLLGLLGYALDQSHEAAFLIDEEARVHYVNQEGCRLLGYSRQELLSMRVPDFDLDFPPERWPGHWRELRAQRSLHFEGRHRSKHGRVFPVEINANFIEFEENILNLALVRDISKRKNLEQERQDHLWFLENLDRINQALRASDDFEQMTNDVLETLLELLQCDRAFMLYPLEPGVQSWHSPIERTRPEFPGCRELGWKLEPDPHLIELLLNAKDPNSAVQFAPGSDYQIPPELAERYGIKSALVMAIYPKVDKPYLFGIHQCSHARVWTPTEERLFQEIGRRLGDSMTSLLISRNLRDSKERLEEAQRIANVGYWEWGAASHRITLSAEVLRIFGLPARETSFALPEWRSRWLELIHPEDRERIIGAVADLVQKAPCYKEEYRIVRPDGSVRYVHSEADVTRDATGCPTRMLGMVQDITERKLAEKQIRSLNAELEQRVNARTQELAESESRFRFLYNTAPVSIAQEDWTEVISLVRNLKAKGVTDLKSFFSRHPAFATSALRAVKVIDFNQWTLGLFEAKDKPELLKSLAAVFSTPEAIAGFVEELVALGEGQTLFQTEMRINTLRGHSFHALVTSSFPPPDSASGYVIVSAIDITERKRFEQELQKSEERLRLFFERQLVGMAFTSPEKGWLKVNDKLCRMLGYSREELARKTWTELTYPEDLPPDLAQFERLQKGEIDSYILEKRFVRKDGTLVFANLSVGCVRRPDGTLDYVLALMEDVTQRKEAERRAEEALHKEVVLRREIHHRVKNNLQVIISLLFLQSSKVTDPVALALFAESQMRVRSIALVHEMLYQRQDLSKIAFADYVRQLASEIFFAFRVSQTTVELKVSCQKAFLEIETAIPCGIIIAELITNCLKYAFPDGAKGQIEVSLRPDDNTGNLVLSVRDDGIGLPAEVDPKRSQTMGMSLVHDLTRQLGGEVEFQPIESGRGTRVRIVFPSED